MNEKKCVWSKPIDGCFTVPRCAPDAPPKFTKLIMPVIRPPWYRRLWRWLTKPFRRKPLSLREVMAQNPIKADWVGSAFYVEHLEKVTKK